VLGPEVKAGFGLWPNTGLGPKHRRVYRSKLIVTILDITILYINGNGERRRTPEFPHITVLNITQIHRLPQ
jgi:hypothetical protein